MTRVPPPGCSFGPLCGIFEVVLLKYKFTVLALHIHTANQTDGLRSKVRHWARQMECGYLFTEGQLSKSKHRLKEQFCSDAL